MKKGCLVRASFFYGIFKTDFIFSPLKNATINPIPYLNIELFIKKIKRESVSVKKKHLISWLLILFLQHK